MEINTAHLPDLILRDHMFELPLDYGDPSRGQIEVFARELTTPENEAHRQDLPILTFLQGGPGFAAPRPPKNGGWIGRALEDYRVLLLDERGTGRSTPVSAQCLSGMSTPEEQAGYLRCFRSDSIVQDCERIRKELIGETEPWSVLGQSYGGFCATHYLSAAPQGLREAFITGGLPSLTATAEEIYRRTYAICARKNREYYERYPCDIERIRELAGYLQENQVQLPSAGPLSLRKLQTLGIHLGFSDGHEVIHYLVEDVFGAPPGPRAPSHFFLRQCENALNYDTNPIFSILHEACYTQGTASNWAAQRVRDEFPEFSPEAEGPLLFTGEMIYPWFFDEFPKLTPLKAAAEILAQSDDWPQLYDSDALAKNEIPTAAAVYVNDMYVEYGASMETSEAIRGIRTWVTDEFEHNGLRSDGRLVLGKLMELLEEDRAGSVEPHSD